MTLEEVRTFLEENKEDEGVRQFLDELRRPSLDDVKKLVDQDEEFKKWLNSEKDRHFSKSLETWKEKTLPTILEEEREKIRKELNPDEDPVRKELNDLKKRLEDKEKAEAREKLRNQVYKQASEKGLPIDLLDFIVASDEETTNKNLETFESVWNNAVKKAKEGVFKEHGRKPASPDNDPGAVTLDQFKSMGYQERAKLAKEKPELFSKLNAEALDN